MEKLILLAVRLAWPSFPQEGAAPPRLDESPARDDEWGYRPEQGTTSDLTPPSFSWRPQRGIASWEIECGRGAGFDEIEHRAGGIEWSIHCPPRAFSPGTYTWRCRGVDRRG